MGVDPSHLRPSWDDPPSTPPKTNMEPDNGPYRKGRFRTWKPPFSGQPAVGGYTVDAIKKLSADLWGKLFLDRFQQKFEPRKKRALVGPGLYRG